MFVSFCKIFEITSQTENLAKFDSKFRYILEIFETNFRIYPQLTNFGGIFGISFEIFVMF